MRSNGRNELVFRHPKNGWEPQTTMEKSRKYLGRLITIGTKHQLTVPLTLVKELGLQRGDTIQFGWISCLRKGKGKRITLDVLREGHRILHATILIRDLR